MAIPAAIAPNRSKSLVVNPIDASLPWTSLMGPLQIVLNLTTVPRGKYPGTPIGPPGDLVLF
jgi:hypothetical protein